MILPPVAIYTKAGVNIHLYLNVFFCFLFYIPAVIHSVWFVRRSEDAFIEPEEFDGVDPYGKSGREKQERIEPTLDW